MPAAAHKSSTVETGSSTDPAVTIGAAADGDTKVLVLFARSTSHSVTLSATPAGYTERAAWAEWDDGDSYVAVYSKAVTTTETSASVGFTLSASCKWAIAGFVATGDWDAIAAESAGRISYGTSAAAGTVNASEANTILFNAICAVDWRKFEPPGGTTETNDVQDSSLEISIATGHESVAAAGATGTRTWTFRSGDDPNTLNAAVGRSAAFTIKATTSGETDALLDGSATFQSASYTYETTSITATPSSFSVDVGASSSTVTLTDQNSLAVEGASWTSSAPSVCSISAASDSSGQATVTFGIAGTATLTASYDDGMSSETTRTVAVTVTAPTTPVTPTTPPTVTPEPVDGTWTRVPRDAEVWIRIPRDS